MAGFGDRSESCGVNPRVKPRRQHGVSVEIAGDFVHGINGAGAQPYLKKFAIHISVLTITLRGRKRKQVSGSGGLDRRDGG